MREAGVLIDLKGAPIYWHMPPGRSGGSLPDSRDLWDVIWENRANLSGFAHTHPGYGNPGPSQTDITTFQAIEAGLGKRLEWPIVSGDSLVVVYHSSLVGDEIDKYLVEGPWEDEHPWVAELRIRSGFPFTPANEPLDGDPRFHGTDAHGCMPCYGCGGFRGPNDVCASLNCSTRMG